MRFLLLAFLYFSLAANAAVYTRQHSDTIVDGKKIIADDINDELDAIAAAVNSIDSGNISDGSILTEDFAATSSATFTTRKRGCLFTTPSSNKLAIEINPPCEILHDSKRGTLVATRQITISSNGLGDFAATGTVYYIYGNATASAEISFHFSRTPPNVLTASKANDPKQRFIGSTITSQASTNFIDMIHTGTRYFLNSIDEQDDIYDPVPLSTSQQTKYWRIPEFARRATFAYEIDPGNNSSATCIVNFNVPVEVQASNATAMRGVLTYEPFVNAGDRNVKRLVDYDAVSNCSGISLGVKGWEEPQSLHN